LYKNGKETAIYKKGNDTQNNTKAQNTQNRKHTKQENEYRKNAANISRVIRK
jgi:hypothetical protein